VVHPSTPTPGWNPCATIPGLGVEQRWGSGWQSLDLPDMKTALWAHEVCGLCVCVCVCVCVQLDCQDLQLSMPGIVFILWLGVGWRRTALIL
jgi:hypothetical protein